MYRAMKLEDTMKIGQQLATSIQKALAVVAKATKHRYRHMLKGNLQTFGDLIVRLLVVDGWAIGRDQ